MNTRNRNLIISRYGGEMPFYLYGIINGYPLLLAAEKGFWAFSISLDPTINVHTIEFPDQEGGWYREGIYHIPDSDPFDPITDEQARNIVNQCVDEFVASHEGYGWLPMTP